MDKHASLKIRKISNKRKLPWFYETIGAKIRFRRRLENRLRKNRTSDNYINLYQQRRIVSNLMDSGERRFFLGKIIENKANYKEVYKICNKLLGWNKDLPLPPDIQLAKDFNKFFINKFRQHLNTINNERADAETGKFPESSKILYLIMWNILSMKHHLKFVNLFLFLPVFSRSHFQH